MLKTNSPFQSILFWKITGGIILCFIGACGNSTGVPVVTSFPPTAPPIDVLLEETSTPLPTPIFVFIRDPETSVSLSSDDLRQRWLHNAPCKAPCWEGLIPGETQAVEAGEILSKNPLFAKIEVVKSALPYDDTGFVDFAWNMQDLRHGNALFNYETPDQKIYLISMGIPQIRLGELIEIYGEPSHIVARDAADKDGVRTWFIDLGWLPQGFLVSRHSLFEPQIDENLEFFGIKYFSPDWMGTEDATGFFPDDITKPWRGYGNYDLYSVTTK